MAIHSTAVVHRGAEIDASADIGPYCVLGAHVRIGPLTRLLGHVVVDNHTTIGARNVIHPFAVVGGNPQDLKFKGEPGRLTIGDDNVIREGATLNIGTATGHMESRIGSHCLLMAYSHVAHDCRLGDHVVLANSVGLAGHVDIGDHAIFGGLSGLHQFCRVGRYAFIAGGGMVAQDVLPFCIAQGDRAQHVGVNVVGLKRAGLSRDVIGEIREAFQELFHSDGTRLVALERTEKVLGNGSPHVREMIDFMRSAKRGVCPPRLAAPPADNFDE